MSRCGRLVGSCVGGALFPGNALLLVLIDLGQILGLFFKINPTYQHPCIWMNEISNRCTQIAYTVLAITTAASEIGATSNTRCHFKFHHEAQTPAFQSPGRIWLRY